MSQGSATRFRCHTGHAFSLDCLLSELTQSVEETLWTSLRAVQETQMLLRHLAEHLRESGDTDMLALIERKVQESVRRENLIRQTVMSDEVLSEDKLKRQEQDEKRRS